MGEDASDATPRCPQCGSRRTEEIETVPRDYEYWCRGCGATFDRDGGDKIVA